MYWEHRREFQFVRHFVINPLGLNIVSVKLPDLRKEYRDTPVIFVTNQRTKTKTKQKQIYIYLYINIYVYTYIYFCPSVTSSFHQSPGPKLRDLNEDKGPLRGY